MNATVTLVIITAWAVAATAAMILALRSRASSIKTLTSVRKDRDKALTLASGFKDENDRLLREFKPARDGSDGLRARQSLVTAARKLATPAKPTSARTSSTSRTKTSDPVIDTATGTTFGAWSVNNGNWDAPSPSCDTSSTSSSSSSDGGSCGGGE